MNGNCPVCGAEINLTSITAKLIGGIKSDIKAEKARENGKKGGRPKGSKTKNNI